MLLYCRWWNTTTKLMIKFVLLLYIIIRNHDTTAAFTKWKRTNSIVINHKCNGCRPQTVRRDLVSVTTNRSTIFKNPLFVTRRKKSRSYEDNPASTKSSSSSSSVSYSPIPVMPSQLFQQLALSQLELLASALPYRPPRNDDNNDAATTSSTTASGSKIKSMALYLPQENVVTGQLEFVPAVLYPNPVSERIFIATDSQTGVAPTLPQTLTKLPGFAHATTLLPTYPMVYSASSAAGTSRSPNHDAGVGIVEEVMCDIRMGGTALSVPLFSGSQTVGVLLVSPAVPPLSKKSNQADALKQQRQFWTKEDKEIVARAAKSLSLALVMDAERTKMEIQNEIAYQSLSDGLHQFKNPLQALRTFSKLLQQRIADTADITNAQGNSNTPRLLELAEHLMVQSDRLVDRLKPVDAIVESLGSQHRRPLAALNPANYSSSATTVGALVPLYATPPKPQPTTPFLLVDDLTQQQQTRRRTRNTNQGNQQPENNSRLLNFVLNATEVAFIPSTTDESNKIFYPYTNIHNNQTQTEINDYAPKVPKRRSKKLSTIMPIIEPTVEYNNSMNNEVPSSGSSPNNIDDNNVGKAIPLVEMNLRMTFVIDVLEPILSVFYAFAEEKRISFVVEGGDNDDLPGIMACEQALQEAFTNVLDNAFKYVVVAKNAEPANDDTNLKWNPSPKVRVLFVSNRKPLNPGVTIYVEDNGPGIPANERSIIFNRGVRGEATQHLVEGNGIGLNIAKSLMESMGGTLDIVDNINNNTAKRRTARSFYDGTTVQMTLYRSLSN